MKAMPNKISWMTLLMIMMMSFIPTLTFANETTVVNPNTEVPAKVQVMLDRLEEIKEMDKSNLSRAEKRELRKEVRAIEKRITFNRKRSLFVCWCNNNNYTTFNFIIVETKNSKCRK